MREVHMKFCFQNGNENRREMTPDEKMGRAINRLRFKSNIWGKSDLDYNRVYMMVNDVRTLSGLPKMDRKLFDDGIQYCHFWTDNYDYSLREFRALCWGDW